MALAWYLQVRRMWIIIMKHHESSWIIMNRHETWWWCITMNHHDSSWRVVMIRLDGSSLCIIMMYGDVSSVCIMLMHKGGFLIWNHDDSPWWTAVLILYYEMLEEPWNVWLVHSNWYGVGAVSVKMHDLFLRIWVIVPLQPLRVTYA